jgi:hypothetical protein
MTEEVRDRALQSLFQVRSSLLHAIEEGQAIPAAHEARVHEAIDLLRAARADSRMLRRVEDISCTLRRMNRYLREGRVNAYDSARLRVRAAARSL